MNACGSYKNANVLKLYANANTANATGWRKMKISPNPLLWYLLQYAWSEMMNDARLDDQQ